MPPASSQSKWPCIVAAVAVRMSLSPEDVRAMRYVDFREVLKVLKVPVKQTQSELQEQIERFIANG